MGETQVGGNLSVHWLVNADDVDPADETAYIASKRPNPRHRSWVQRGADYHRKSARCGDRFTVRIKLPDDADRFIASVLRGLADAKTKGRLEFELTIEKAPVAHTQIQVAWAGGKKNAPAPRWSDGLSKTLPGTVSESGRKSTKASRSSKQAT